VEDSGWEQFCSILPVFGSSIVEWGLNCIILEEGETKAMRENLDLYHGSQAKKGEPLRAGLKETRNSI